MAECFLPADTTLFSCPANSVPLRCNYQGNVSIQGGGSLLTIDARLMAVGICQIKTAAAQGVPQPCSCQTTSWISYSRTSFVNGKPLLTTSSKTQCTVGGMMISVKQILGQKKAGVGQRLVETVAISLDSYDWDAINQSAKGTKNSKENFSHTASSPASAVQGEEVGNGQSVLEKDHITKNKVAAKKDKRSVAILENMLCSGDCTEAKRNSCPYYQDHLKRPDEAVVVHNESQLLAENYMEATAEVRDDIDEYYYRLRNRYGKRYWSYAAHHVISGNQVFKQQTELVRLADFLHYDINNAKNCIYLVSKGDGYGAEKAAERPVSAYDAMDRSRLQWHVGGHQYTLPKEDIQTIKMRVMKLTGKQVVDLQSYADLLRQEMNDFSDELRQQQRCWYSSEKDAQKNLESAFQCGMDSISQRIRHKLGAFTKAPGQSYPYYVSKEAYRFAFTLPKTEKCIVIRQKQNGLNLCRYRISHRAHRQTQRDGTDFLILKPIIHDNSDSTFFLPLPVRRDKAYQELQQKCIIFCENIRHFLFVDTDVSPWMPFRPDFTKVMVSETWEQTCSDEDLLKSGKRQSELLAWFRDEHSEHYMAPFAMIHQRLQEWRDLYG